MVRGVGIDVASIERTERLVRRYDETTLSILFTAEERTSAAASRDSAELRTICFAGKEAVGKALGTGLGGIGWNEIAIHPSGGAIEIALSGAAAAVAAARDVTTWRASWSRAGDMVIVTAIASAERG